MNTSNKSSPPKPYTASSREIWAWGIGAIACHALIQVYGQASNIFNIGFGLDAVIVSWCMMLPRIVDGIADPIMGHLSDNTHTRWGRRKPYLVIGAILGAFFVSALWWANPAWPHKAQFAYLFVVGTFFYVSYGIYSMAWTAMGYELTDDYNERSRVAAIAGVFLAVVTFSAQWMYRLALCPIFGNEIIGMRWISAICGVVIIATALITTMVCKERFTQGNRKEHVPILPALKATMKNSPFVIMLGVRLCQLFAERAALGLLLYLGIFYVCNGDKKTATGIVGMGATAGTILGYFVLPAMKPITESIGKRNAQIYSAAITMLMALALPFVLTPSHAYWLMIPTLVAIPLSTLNNTLSQAMVPDICDIDEVEHGKRREGLFTAVLGFFAKFSISLCFLIVGYTLKLAGFNPQLPVQPVEVLDRLFWFCVIPNIIFSGVGLLLTILFPVTAETMKQVRHQLDERHMAKAAAEEPVTAS